MDNIKKELKIMEVSACSYAESKLKINADTNARIACMIKNISERDYDIISCREMPYHTLTRLQESGIIADYNVFYHNEFNNEIEKWRFRCLQVLLVKKGIDFIPEDRSDFTTIYRCITGKLMFNGSEIYYKTNHVPCVDNNKSNLNAQLERKKSFLLDEISFQRATADKLAISAGDFNISSGGNEYCSQYFDRFIFKDKVHVPTYQDKCLDHCLVSPAFDHSAIKVSVDVLDKYYSVFTDHRPIEIRLEALS